MPRKHLRPQPIPFWLLRLQILPLHMPPLMPLLKRLPHRLLPILPPQRPRLPLHRLQPMPLLTMPLSPLPMLLTQALPLRTISPRLLAQPRFPPMQR